MEQSPSAMEAEVREGHSSPDTILRKLQDFQEEAEGLEGHRRGPEGPKGKHSITVV